ncbi:MAG: oligosaccharide flippase family protein [Aquabacterium sp.]|uniref:lipid II flippase MurJ n=1 Tax=Aquabacterium sp. TaxID=1872578 RepID=UPI0025C038B5|nr:lipid II flippase MurJ [Aquabacterium sp.]MBI5925135.1 oligosaccharide flippase family protein [Aquabacterium sp.]
MLGAASLLTLVTLAGLVAGFAREWLLVASWGAGARTDAFVIAMFIPEAVRSMLAAGLLTSSALTLWQQRAATERAHWFSQLSQVLGLGGFGLAALISLGSPWLVHLMGPGLATEPLAHTVSALHILAWSLPGLVLQAWWAVPRQAAGHFLLAGMGSLLYNLPAMLYLWWCGPQAQEDALSWAFVSGSLTMGLVMLPSALRSGLRPVSLRGSAGAFAELGHKLAPLLGSAMAGQGLTLLERIVASYLGEGVVSAVNLARKLINLPLIALQSLNQVLLSLMSRSESERVALLRKGLAAVTVVSLPASLGLMLGAPALVSLLFPKVQGAEVVVPLLAGYAAVLVLASWNTLLARFHYAEGDTRGPVVAELRGSLLQALALPPLAWLAGSLGIVWALLLGTLLTGQLLLRVPALKRGLGLVPQALVCALWLMAAWWGIKPWLSQQIVWQLMQAAVVGSLCLIVMALWLRPWQSR